MSLALVLINGVPRQQTVTVSLPAIYDEAIEIVASGATPPTSLNGPVTTGTAITLPYSETYTVSSGVSNMNVMLNGQYLEYVYDWSTAGSGPNYSQLQLTFDLEVSDLLELRIERNS